MALGLSGSAGVLMVLVGESTGTAPSRVNEKVSEATGTQLCHRRRSVCRVELAQPVDAALAAVDSRCGGEASAW